MRTKQFMVPARSRIGVEAATNRSTELSFGTGGRSSEHHAEQGFGTLRRRFRVPHALPTEGVTIESE